jgi:hypothetical protein
MAEIEQVVICMADQRMTLNQRDPGGTGRLKDDADERDEGL